MKTTNEYRVEHDLLGKRELPVDALYGDARCARYP